MYALSDRIAALVGADHRVLARSRAIGVLHGDVDIHGAGAAGEAAVVLGEKRVPVQGALLVVSAVVGDGRRAAGRDGLGVLVGDGL